MKKIKKNKKSNVAQNTAPNLWYQWHRTIHVCHGYSLKYFSQYETFLSQAVRVYRPCNFDICDDHSIT
jgi:hypothetical protein